MLQKPPSLEHPAQSAVFRSELRRQKIAAREAMPDTLHARLSQQVEAVLEELLAARAKVGSPDTAAPVLGFCWPVRKEFDARATAQRLLARGGSACLPVVVAEGQPLHFRAWSPGAKTAPDRYGIPTPVAGREMKPDILLIPLVAFDAGNFRIGYGGGFFDRTLAAVSPRPLAIGVGYEIARVDDTYPGPHDIALDFIVTEAGVQEASR